MAQSVRYRIGIDKETGRLLTGRAHLTQSLADIWRTRTNTRVLLLDYGSNLRDLLSEDITPSLVLQIYAEMIGAAHRWEPEARISDLQLVRLTQTGQLALEYGGLYYPHGRFGDYSFSEPLNQRYALADRRRSEAVA